MSKDTLTGTDLPTEADSAARGPSSLGKNILVAVLAGLFFNTLFGLFLDYRNLLETFARIRLWQIALPFAVIVIVYMVDSLRYLNTFRQFGVRLSFRDAFYNNVIGNFINGITPSSAGGQPFQVYHFSKLGLDTTTSTNIVFSRLMISNLAQLLVVVGFAHKGIGLLGAAGKGAYILGLGMATTVVFTVILILVFMKPHIIGRLALRMEGGRLGHFISRRTHDEHWAEKISAWSFGLRDSFRFLWTGRIGTMLIDLILFGFDQVVWALGLYFPLIALTGVSIHFGSFLFAFILCGLVSSYIPTPGASGSVEAAYALVLGGITGEPGASFSAIILWRFGSYYLHLILGGLVYFLVPTRRNSYSRGADGLIRRSRAAG